MKLNLEQKKALSNYSGNLSIAWVAAGVIGPIVTKQSFNETKNIIFISLLLSGFFLYAMLILIKYKRRRKRK